MILNLYIVARSSLPIEIGDLGGLMELTPSAINILNDLGSSHGSATAIELLSTDFVLVVSRFEVTRLGVVVTPDATVSVETATEIREATRRSFISSAQVTAAHFQSLLSR